MSRIPADLIPVSRAEALEATTACMKSIDATRQKNWEKAIEQAMTERLYPFWKFWRKERMNREQAIHYLSQVDGMWRSAKTEIFFQFNGQYETASNVKRACEISTEDKVYLSSETISLIAYCWPKK